RRHTRSKRDWSSDVCSSDLIAQVLLRLLTVLVEDPANHQQIPAEGGLPHGAVREVAHPARIDTPPREHRRDVRARLELNGPDLRSEERRVGKERGSQMTTAH